MSHLDAPASHQEIKYGLGEKGLPSFRSGKEGMSRVWNDPKIGVWDRPILFDWMRDGEGLVTIPMHNQSLSGDGGKEGRCEVEVVVTVFKTMELGCQLSGLLCAPRVSTTCVFKGPRRKVIRRLLSVDRPGLLGEVRGT